MTSAAIGARMAAIRAKILQIPKEVERKSGGKTKMFTMVRTLQAAAIPRREQNKKIGMREGLSDKLIMQRLDIAVKENENMREILPPIY